MGACLDCSRASKAAGVATICPSKNFDMVHQSNSWGIDYSVQLRD